jgi:hypothetical protein
LFGFICVAGQCVFEEMLHLSQAGRLGNRNGNSAAHAGMDGAFTGWFPFSIIKQRDSKVSGANVYE